MLILIQTITLTLFVGCDYLPFSGGRLDGSNSVPPKDWSSALEQEIIQLENTSTRLKSKKYKTPYEIFGYKPFILNKSFYKELV